MHLSWSNAASKLTFLQKQNEPFVLYMQGLSQLTANLGAAHGSGLPPGPERRDTPVYLAATLSGKAPMQWRRNALVKGFAAMYATSYFAVKVARGDVPQNIRRHVHN